MSLPLKFRAWDKRQRKFHYTEIADILLPDSDQFTGLKDGFGTEIYGGDILKCQSDGSLLVVSWNEDEAAFFAGGYYLTTALYDPESQACEVIGNIYSNPELLTPPQKEINHE